MTKGYWIVRVDITDPEAYKGYVAANAEAFRKFGAHFLVRSGQYETVEGGSRGREQRCAQEEGRGANDDQ